MGQHIGLFDRPSRNARRLPAAEQPANDHSHNGYPNEDYEQIGDRHVAEWE